jgi:hypothetical protein
LHGFATGDCEPGNLSKELVRTLSTVGVSDEDDSAESSQYNETKEDACCARE